jgi:hypothetical protein
MRIVLHDFPGHAFPVQLARSLAGRGHEVLHLHFGGIATPKGLLLTTDDDPQTLSIEQLSLDRPFRKHSFVRRLIQEREVGRILGARIRAARPDVVISGNGPLDVQDRALRAAHAAGMAAADRAVADPRRSSGSFWQPSSS